MTTHLLEYFRDENQGLYRSHPLEVIRATTLAAAGNPYGDSNDRIGAERVVYYNDTGDDANQNETRLVLRLVEHAGGAWAKGVDPLPAGHGIQAGFTEGRLLHSDGTMAAALGATSQIQGALFANYYDLLTNRLQDARVVTAQQNGDLYWVVVEGMIELWAGEDSLDVNETFISADDAEGGRAEFADPASEEASPRYVLGICLEDGAPDALANCLMDIRATGYRQFA